MAYLDNDPIVLAHGRAMLAEDEFTVVVKADIRQPEQILTCGSSTRESRRAPSGGRTPILAS